MAHKRILSSIFLISAFVVIVTFSTSFPYLPFLLVNFIVAIGALEFYSMVQRKGIKVFKVYGTIASVILLSAIFFDVVIFKLNNFELEGIVVFLIVCILLVKGLAHYSFS